MYVCVYIQCICASLYKEEEEEDNLLCMYVSPCMVSCICTNSVEYACVYVQVHKTMYSIRVCLRVHTRMR